MTGGDQRSWRWALGLVAAGVLARLVLALLVPPFPDETYYWEWSRHPAFGYFDHPPAIAFLIGAGTAIVGNTVLGIRLGAVVGGGVAALGVVLLAGRLGGGRAAFRAALILTCMPLAAAGLLLATPDAPLLLASALTYLALDRALRHPVGSRAEVGWWLLAGTAAGLGFVSKLTAVLVPFGITVAFLVHPELRRRLRSPGPWLAAGVALLLFAPFVVWNARNDWISIAFQLGHGLGSGGGSPLLRELELLGGQLGLVSPILFGLLAWSCVAALRDPEPRRFVLAASAIAVFGFFVLSALRKPAEANWPAAAYVPATVVLATAAWGPRMERWFRWGLGLGGALVAVVYLQAVVPWLPLSPGDDPIARAHGWDGLASAVDSAAKVLSSGGCETVWLGARTYQAASETAFHLPGQPFVLSTNLMSRTNQYDRWPGFTELASEGDCLVLFGAEPGTLEAAEALQPVFRDAQPHTAVVRTRAGGEIDAYNIWLLAGWTGDATPFR